MKYLRVGAQQITPATGYSKNDRRHNSDQAERLRTVVSTWPQFQLFLCADGHGFVCARSRKNRYIFITSPSYVFQMCLVSLNHALFELYFNTGSKSVLM